MRHLLPNCLLVAALLLAACATPEATSQRPPGPDETDVRWRELRTPHFLFITDFDSAHARERLGLLEDLRAQQLAAAWPQATQSGPPIEVVCFRSRKSLDEWTTPPDNDQFWFDAEGGIPVIVWFNEFEDQGWIKHQLFHANAARFGTRGPPWLEEGLASYFSATHVREGSDVLDFGGPVSAYAQSHLPVSQLLHYTHSDLVSLRDDHREFMSTAAALVTYLINDQPAAWLELQKLIHEGQDANVALWSVLPGFDEQKLDQALKTFDVRVRHLPRPTVEPVQITERLLSESEVTDLRASLMVLERGTPKQEELRAARTILNEGLQRLPGDARLLESLAAIDAEEGHCPDALHRDAQASGREGAAPQKHAFVMDRCSPKASIP